VNNRLKHKGYIGSIEDDLTRQALNEFLQHHCAQPLPTIG
jgi:hypothetical protein